MADSNSFIILGMLHHVAKNIVYKSLAMKYQKLLKGYQ